MLFFLALLANASGQQPSNNRPTIGVLSEELTDKMIENYGQHDSYIGSSYVQFVHGAGGRAVPILIGQNESYYNEILSYVNGVVFPGGSVWFDDKKGGYVEAGKKILQYAEYVNSRGDYFPIWGTCLGFELLTYLENKEVEMRVNCSAYNISSPLKLTPDSSRSRLFLNLSSDIEEAMTTMNTTANFHNFCITPKDMNEKLDSGWMTLSTNVDVNGLEFVSTIENRERPYFATQWHPEKPIYEWGHFAIPHDQYAVRVGQYMANFFVSEARRNNHTFPSETIEREYLIYKYPATYGHPTSTYTQLYFFD